MVAIVEQFELGQVGIPSPFDGLGNWRRFVTDPVGGSETTQIRQHNGLNEITRVNSTPFEYDGVPGASNGNLANDGTLKYEWDALNRLRIVKRVSDNATIGTYTYDAMNRRIRKVVTNGGLSGAIPNGTTDCLYEGWRCVEERDGSNNPTKQYVWGIYLDELVQQKNITAINNFTTNAELYPLQDLLYRTTALADSAGTLREAYDYDAYGNTLIFRNAGTPPSAITWTSDTQVANPTCPFLFTGQRFDAETENYYYKERYYSPEWGRFPTKDDEWRHDILSNWYIYVKCNPANAVDPQGNITFPISLRPGDIPKCEAICAAKGKVTTGAIRTKTIRISYSFFCTYTTSWEDLWCPCRNPPKNSGTCTPQELAYLQVAKDAACIGARKPTPKMSCEILWALETANSFCAAARRSIQTRCFKGKTDKVHQDLIDQHTKWAKDAWTFYVKRGCPRPPIYSPGGGSAQV